MKPGSLQVSSTSCPYTDSTSSLEKHELSTRRAEVKAFCFPPPCEGVHVPVDSKLRVSGDPYSRRLEAHK